MEPWLFRLSTMVVSSRLSLAVCALPGVAPKNAPELVTLRWPPLPSFSRRRFMKNQVAAPMAASANTPTTTPTAMPTLEPVEVPVLLGVGVDDAAPLAAFPVGTGATV